MEEQQDPQLPKGYSVDQSTDTIPALPGGYSLAEDDVKKKELSGSDSQSGSTTSVIGSNGSQGSQNDPPSKKKRSFLDFDKINKTNFSPQIKDESGNVTGIPTGKIPLKERERKPVGEVINLSNDIKNRSRTIDAERLQTVNENIGVNKFADFIDTQDTPNAKLIANDIRTNAQSWSELPVEAREQMRDYAHQTSITEAQQMIQKNNAQLKIAQAKLAMLDEKSSIWDYNKERKADEYNERKQLQDQIDQLHNNNAIQKTKPGLLTVNVFKNDDDLLQGLAPQSEQYLQKVRDNDPVAYDHLARSAYEGTLNVDQKNEIIKGSLDIKRSQIEADYNTLKDTGTIDRVREYNDLQQKFSLANRDAEAFASKIGLTKGTPTIEEKAQYEILHAKAKGFADRMIDYQGQGIEEESNKLHALNAQMKTQADMVTSSSLKYDLFHDEDKQKEVDEFVNQHPVIGRLWEGVKAVSSVPAKIAKSGAVIGETLYDTGKKAIGDASQTETGAYNKLSGRFSAADFFDSLIPRRAGINLLNNDNDVQYSNIANKAVDTLSDMAALILGGNGSSVGIKALGAGEELAAGAGLMLSSYGQSRPDYFKHAISAGMSAQDAGKFADASAILTSSLELISPNKLLFGEEAKAEFSQEFAKYFAKDGWKYAFEKSSERLFKEIIPENIQELSQSIGDKAVEFAANKVYNKNIFDANLSYAEVKETVILTTLATGLLTGIRNRSLNNEERQNYLFQSAKDLGAFQTALDNVPINNADKSALSDQVYAYNKAINSIPSGVSEEIQQHITPLLVAKQKLVDQIAGPTDEAFKKSAREKIAVIDNTVIGLTDGKYNTRAIVVTDDPNQAAIENSEENITQRIDPIVPPAPLAIIQPSIVPVTQSVTEQTNPSLNEGISPTDQGLAEENSVSSTNPISENRNKDIFADVTPFGNIVGHSGVDANLSSYHEVDGVGVAQYTNPDNGLVDVYLSGNSEDNYVGFIRIYENGQPTNRFTSKFQNLTGTKEQFKTMMSEVQKQLPENHQYTESTSISTDGLKIYDQQLNRGYQILTDENGDPVKKTVTINIGSKVNELGVDLRPADFSNIRVLNDVDFQKAKSKILTLTKGLGITAEDILHRRNTIEIRLPILEKIGNTAPVAEVNSSINNADVSLAGNESSQVDVSSGVEGATVENDVIRNFSVLTQNHGQVEFTEKTDGNFEAKFDDGSTDTFDRNTLKSEFGIDPDASTANEVDYKLSSETDPTIVAKLYDDKVKELSDPGSKESAIAQYGPSSNDEEFANNNDRNNITPEVRRSYFSQNNGIPLDTQAQEINDQYFNGQQVVTPGDIADFMVAYPNGGQSFTNQSGNEDLRKIAAKYKELTGKNLTSNAAERLAQKYNASEVEVRTAENLAKSQSEKIDNFIEQEIGLTEGFVEPDVAADKLIEELDSYISDPSNDFNLYFPIFNGILPTEDQINNTKGLINERRTGQIENQGNDNRSTDGNNSSEQGGVTGTAISERQPGFTEETSDPLAFLNDADIAEAITEDTILDGEAANALSDRIKALKIKTGGNLYSSPLGIPVFMYNTALDIIAKGIQANNSVAISIGKGVTYVIDELKKLGGSVSFTPEELTKAFNDDLKKKGVINNDRKAELADILKKATAKQATNFIRRGINTAEEFAKAIGKDLTPEIREAFTIAEQAVKSNPNNPRSEVDSILGNTTPIPITSSPTINPGETKAEYAKRLIEYRKDQGSDNSAPNNLTELNDLKRDMRKRFDAFSQGAEAGATQANQTQAEIDKQLDGLRQRVIDIVAKIKSDGLLRSTGTGRQKILSIIQRVSQAGNNPNALYRAVDYAIKQVEHLNYEKNIADAQSARSIISKMYFMSNQKAVSEFRNLDPNTVPSDMLDKYMDLLQNLKESNIIDWTQFKADAREIIDGSYVPMIEQAPTGLNAYLPIPDFAKEKKTWKDSLREAMVKFKRNWLDYKKGLPKELYDLQERAQGIVDREANRAIVNATALDRLLAKDKSIKATDVDAALRGDQEALNRLPEAVAESVVTMRAHVDGLSATLITAGLITPAQMANVEVHLGEYLTRSYRLYNDKNWTMENLPEPIYTKAAEFLFKQMYPTYKAEMSGATEDEISHATSEAVKARINEYFSKTENEYFQAGKIGSKDLSLFDHRKKIPEQIRALFGEVTDPITNYTHTVFKIANLATNANFLNNLKNNYTGIYFFDANDPNRTANHSVKIAADGSETMSPLNGMYTTPELAESFNKIEDKTSDFVKKYMAFIGLVKAGKTVGSVVTHIKNIEGNVGFVLANGHFNFGEFKNAVLAVRDDLKHTDTKRLHEIIQPLIALGVIKQSVGANEIREMFNPNGLLASTFMNTFGEDRKGIDKIKNLGNRALKWTTDLYEAEDNVFKVFAYLNDVKRYSHALFGPDVNALVPVGQQGGLTVQQKEQLDTYVAELIKNTYPTFSRVPDIARLASKYIPIGGNFIGFAAESYRVQKNLYFQMVKELRDPNPEIKKIGAQRLVGLGIYAGIKVALIKFAGSAGIAGLSGLLGADDDDDEKLHQASRRFMAPWSKNSDNIVTGGKDGKFSYIDFSSQDPFGNSSSVLNAFANGESITEKAIGAAAEFFGPFTDQELTFKAVSNLYENKDDRGAEIYNEGDDAYHKGMNIAAYFEKQLEPGTIASIRRAIEKGPQTLNPVYRETDVDVVQQFGFMQRDNKKKLETIANIYNKAFYKEKSDVAVVNAYDRAKGFAAEQVLEMHKDYAAAIQLGASPKDLKDALKKQRLDGEVVRMITTGNIRENRIIKKKKGQPK